MYKILITKRAIKDLEKIDIKTKSRIGDKIKLLINEYLRLLFKNNSQSNQNIIRVSQCVSREI